MRRSQTAAATRARLEKTALTLFLRHGFHAVGLRDLASEAGVSLGAIYNHYEGKEALFAALLDTLHADFSASTEPLAQFCATCQLPRDLERLGGVMREMVSRHPAYLKLVYIDIAEHGGKHARAHYRALAARFASAMPPQRRQLPAWADPGAVFTLIYMQFANHFAVEQLLGAKGYLGPSGDAAIHLISKLFTLGLAPRATKDSP